MSTEKSNAEVNKEEDRCRHGTSTGELIHSFHSKQDSLHIQGGDCDSLFMNGAVGSSEEHKPGDID